MKAVAAARMPYDSDMIVRDLGLMPYRDAWALQEAAHDAVVAGGEEELLLVEHPPVITFGRRPGGERHLLATPRRWPARGRSRAERSRRRRHLPRPRPDRRLSHRQAHQPPPLRRRYVRRLEDVVIATLTRFDIAASKDDTAIGVWVPPATLSSGPEYRVRRRAKNLRSRRPHPQRHQPSRHRARMSKQTCPISTSSSRAASPTARRLPCENYSATAPPSSRPSASRSRCSC